MDGVRTCFWVLVGICLLGGGFDDTVLGCDIVDTCFVGLFAFLELACRHPNPAQEVLVSKPNNNRVMVGLETPSKAAASLVDGKYFSTSPVFRQIFSTGLRPFLNGRLATFSLLVR
jgi:hypothetical protein